MSETNESLYCTYCYGDLIPLGTLGTIIHYRCRHCGLQFSGKITSNQETLNQDE